MAEAYGFFIKPECKIMQAVDFGKRAKPTKIMTSDFLERVSESKETFSESVDHEKFD